MTGDCHVQFGERLAGKFRWPTQLDFSLSIPHSSKRKERSASIAFEKEKINKISESLKMFTVSKPLMGTNDSKQYNATLSYDSKVTGAEGRILIEIGLREEHLTEPEYKNANSLLADPFTSQQKIKPFAIKCLTLEEAYAEKIRAALTRKKPAIRDFFDIEYAIKNKIININDRKIIDLIKKKLSLPGCDAIDLSSDKFRLLQGKISSELKPTLQQESDFSFELNSVFKYLEDYAETHLENWMVPA